MGLLAASFIIFISFLQTQNISHSLFFHTHMTSPSTRKHGCADIRGFSFTSFETLETTNELSYMRMSILVKHFHFLACGFMASRNEAI